MAKELDRTFIAEYTDGAEEKQSVSCELLNPTTEQLSEATAVYNRTWKSGVKNGAILAAKLKSFVREHELWSDEQEAQVKELRAKLHKYEVKLAEGGISLKSARTMAIDMRKLRFELRELVTIETELENRTAESQAEDARQNYLITACTVYTDSREPLWADSGAYQNAEIPELVMAANLKYAKLKWGIDENFESKLPENAFLKNYGFVNKDMRLVNSDNQLVNVEGKLIDEEGFLLNGEGQRVDDEGNLLDKDGLVKIENPQPFLDEDGNPVAPIDDDDVSPAPPAGE